MSDTDPSENVKKGSDNIIQSLNLLKQGLQHYILSIKASAKQHPIIASFILAPITTVAGGAIIKGLNSIYTYFFGATVAVSRDIAVKVFPAPVGFTLWILLTGFLLHSLLSYFRLKELDQKIKQIEQEVGED